MLDNTYSAENGLYDLRVIIHGNGNDRVLNKPTLDKLGVKVAIGDECLKWKGGTDCQWDAGVWSLRPGRFQ